jgi:hypothetical protein
MASEIHTAGTPTAVTAAINAMQPSLHPGQANQLSRVQSAAIAEVQAFPNATQVLVDISCHRDNNTSHISIRVQPVKLNRDGNIELPSP